MAEAQLQQQTPLPKDSKKRKKRKYLNDDDDANNADNESSDTPNNGEGNSKKRNMEYIAPLSSSGGNRHAEKEDDAEDEEDEEGVIATKEEFEQYRAEVLSRVPKSVKSRFREGGFSRWGKDWLPILELGPFDVEPGPVRDMWFDMFNNVSVFAPKHVSDLFTEMC